MGQQSLFVNNQVTICVALIPSNDLTYSLWDPNKIQQKFQSNIVAAVLRDKNTTLCHDNSCA